MSRLYAATGDSIARLDEAGDGWDARVALEGSGAQCLAVDPANGDVVYAGLRAGGVRKSEDGGETWRELAFPHPEVFSLAVSAADGAVYAGTEPSMLFCSEDGGETWRELSTLRDLPSQPTWSFPPRPWTSHVRWIAPSPHEAGRILVGIELGGLMVTLDRGETWNDHRPDAQPDVHSLAWHPTVAERAYEAGGGGSAWSSDAGWTWTRADEGRDRNYTWSVAPDPDDPDRWFVSASTGPFAAHGGRNAQARIFRRTGDAPWEAVTDELPQMPYALRFLDGRLLAGLSDGRVLASEDRGDSWHELPLRGDAITRIGALVAA
jgi:photosystem II stability/assembly factor-like uncharacterized protein